MMAFGINLLTSRQLWQKCAETVSRRTCIYAGAATHPMVNIVAGSSSKMPFTNCQNRYPSPSKRSGLSRVRPRPFHGLCRFRSVANAGSADCGQNLKKPFAPDASKYETVAAKQFCLREGSSTCLKKPGSLQSSLWLALAPVWKTTPNAGSRVLLAAQSLPMHWAAMPLWVRLSAAAQVCSATISASAIKAAAAREIARNQLSFRTIGAAVPVVFFVLPAAGQRPAAMT